MKTLPEIIAHRGATYLAPENTLTAFQNAIVLGADGVEMDVQQTKDQGLIIHHDYLIDLGTEISAKIYDLTLGELEDIDLTKWNGVDFTTEKMPTLAEALAFCSGLEGCTVQLELKAPILPDPTFVPRVVEQIRASGLGERLLLVSFRHDLLQQAKELMPELRVGILTLGSLPSMMLPPPVLWKDLGLVNSMDGELDEDTVMMDALDAGAEDFSPDGPVFEITTDPDSFNDVVKALEDKGYTFESAEIEMVPQNYVTMTGEDDVKSMNKLIDMLEDNEDVQNVWHNWQQD